MQIIQLDKGDGCVVVCDGREFKIVVLKADRDKARLRIDGNDEEMQVTHEPPEEKPLTSDRLSA